MAGPRTTAFLTVIGLLGSASFARAESAIVLPTVTPAGEGGTQVRRPSERDGPLVERAREIDAVLADAAQDLGLSIDVGRRGAETAQARDADFAESAAGLGAWVFSPRIERDGGDLLVRIVALPPGSKVVLVRAERMSAERMPVRLVVMLRDLVRANAGKVTHEPKGGRAAPIASAEPAVRTRSDGRAVLALTSAAYGGFLGYALQRAGGGDDPRLLYPLIALGTGVGLGASMIVADEWDVSTADASFVAAGTVWPSFGAFSLARGYAQGQADRYGYALAGGGVGLGFASLVLSRRAVTDGQATLVHSGAAYGTFLGGATEFLVRGDASRTPHRGLGYGSLGGVLVAGAVAPYVPVSSGRVLTTDLGAVLGGLVGAAAGSPLLLAEGRTPNRERAWTGLTVAGSLAGIGAALLFTRPSTKPLPKAAQLLRNLAPSPAIVGASEVRGQAPVPAMGLAWYGSLR